MRHWDKWKYGASQLRFSSRERIPRENYAQFGHSPAKMYSSLALDRKNLKNTGVKWRQNYWFARGVHKPRAGAIQNLNSASSERLGLRRIFCYSARALVFVCVCVCVCV